VIVKIKVLGWPADVARLPTLGKIDEEHVEFRAPGLQALDRAY